MKRFAFLPLLFALVSCSKEKDQAPGYDGPYPSGPAQDAVKALKGKTVKDAAGNAWTVKWFAVVPNDASPHGKGPVVELERGGVKRCLPVETDGDVADLHKRATGSPHPTITGTPSQTYLDGWAKFNAN